MNFIDLNAQQQRIKKNIDDAIQRVFAHGKYIQGPEVSQLEAQLAKYVGVRHCISCANGTDALQISLMTLGIGPGDEVITPAFSFIATAEAILLVGATPVFVDINAETYALDPTGLKDAITKSTKAIIPVSLFGQCPDFDVINEIAAGHQIPVIEDAAQSFGATYKGKKSCSLTQMATTSFFPSKPLGCYGDGGAIFTDDEELATISRQIATHGQNKRYHHIRLGMNSRLDTIQAAILLEKMTIFDDEINRREEVSKIYDYHLNNAGIAPPKIESYGKSVFGQYTIRVKNRTHIQADLLKHGIPTAIHYPIPLNRQLVINNADNFCNAEAASNEVLSLPFHPYLSESKIKKITECILTLN